MAVVTLVHPEEERSIPVLQAITKCTLFQNNVALATAPYKVQSVVALSVFREFAASLEDGPIEITAANFPGLFQLCAEFGFEELGHRISVFRDSMGFRDAEAHERIARLEENALRRDRDFAVLHCEFAKLASDVARLSEEVSALKSQIQPKIPLDSRIISEFPEIFAEFQCKIFELLWRGSRDGFGGRDFHRRCDGHPNTLTVILDTNGNIFGGFTPVEWESPPKRKYKEDESLRSFIFTLKNPMNVPARKFGLAARAKHRAIECDAERGPRFSEIGIADGCNANTRSYAYFDGSNDSYTNDTGLDGKTFFTGARTFQVKEIEVFEIVEPRVLEDEKRWVCDFVNLV